MGIAPMVLLIKLVLRLTVVAINTRIMGFVI